MEVSRRFGASAEKAINNAYLELMRHVWLFVALPFACFVMFRPLARSFTSDFQEFVRFSRSPCIVTEGARLLAVIVVLIVLLAPFVLGSLLGLLRPGIDFAAACNGLCSCAAPLAFVLLFVYLLVSHNVSHEVAVGAGAVSPFFFSGLSHYLDKLDKNAAVSALSNALPPGLPYSIDKSWDPAIRSALAFSVGVIAWRLLLCSKTRWLWANPRRELCSSKSKGA